MLIRYKFLLVFFDNSGNNVAEKITNIFATSKTEAYIKVDNTAYATLSTISNAAGYDIKEVK